jgi:chemotaxis protein MotA
VIESGKLSSLYSLSALIVIVGGTLCATLTAFTLSDILKIPRLLRDALRMPKADEPALLELFVNLAEKARRDGLLSLETDVEHELDDPRYDPLIRKGLALVVDGAEPDMIREVLTYDIRGFEERRKREAAVFEAAGGYSPTMGIIGTVLGLIRVLGSLEDPSSLGRAIALAFIATLYGIALANLFWLPVAGKLKLRMRTEKYKKEFIMSGVLSIQAGDNPRITRDRLATFLDEAAQKAIERIPIEQMEGKQ